MSNRLQEIKENAVTTKQHDFFTEMPYEDYEWLIEQSKKVEKYETALQQIMNVNEKHEWNLYGLAYAIAERALLK